MTSPVRVKVRAKPTDTGWEFSMTCPEKAEWSVSRTVTAFDEEPHYPRPQLPCGNNCEHLLCLKSDAKTVRSTLSKLALRDVKPEVVERFGRYLFDTLMGVEWTRVTTLAVELHRDVVELALIWPYPNGGPADSSCAALAQLPWEMMRDEHNQYLAAAGDGVGVAVTRVIADTDYDARPFSVPPRVLFVVGAALADQSVRAGAEMLALLREVREAGCRVQFRILENATTKRIRDAMNAFRPDIVHFISHGNLDGEGRGQLELKSETGKPEPWPAERLLQHLWVDGGLPPVVVLSACDTGGKVIVGSQVAAPLAAELVHGGIPVVMAMAGTVSDRACRVFTRYFGRELAAGESLVAATAHARRLAFAETPTGADWALPTVFFSEAVDANAIRRSDDPAAQYVDSFVDNARWKQIPVFCARENILQAFWAMLGNGSTTGWEVNPGRQPSVLAVCASDKGVGKTRLLEHLAREALLSGHLPLMIGTNKAHPAPGDVLSLAERIVDAMQQLGKVLKTDIPLGAELKKFARRDPTRALDPDILLSSDEEVAELAVQLEQDSDELRTAAAAKYPELFTDASRVVLLIDELGETSDTLLDKLFDHENGLDHNGLGSDRHPVPVVLVVLTDGAPGIRTDLLTGNKAETWLVSRELLGFNNGGEAMLAYELLLLNPWRRTGNELEQQWIFNREPAMETRNADHASYFLQGLPAYFETDRYMFFVQSGVINDVLKSAEDDIPVSAVR